MDARNTAQGNTVIQGNTYYQKKTGVWFCYMNQVYPFKFYLLYTDSIVLTNVLNKSSVKGSLNRRVCLLAGG